MFPISTAVPSTFEAFMAANDLTHDHPNLDGWRRVWQNQLQVEATVPAVTPPCPAWCTLPAGHEYDSTDGWGDDLVFLRRHVAFEGGKIADVSATERNHAGTVTVDEPGIFLSVADDDYPVEQVIVIAAELLESAVVLDRITR